jgi:hypothetical protein
LSLACWLKAKSNTDDALLCQLRQRQVARVWSHLLAVTAFALVAHPPVANYSGSVDAQNFAMPFELISSVLQTVMDVKGRRLAWSQAAAFSQQGRGISAATVSHTRRTRSLRAARTPAREKLVSAIQSGLAQAC